MKTLLAHIGWYFDKAEARKEALWMKQNGMNLASKDDMIRKGHFNHGYHHNPDGRDIRPPHHIHFPTVNYPALDRTHTYAYSVQANNDYISALKRLCIDTNIDLHNATLPLIRAW
jgi:hypothetical protein